MTANEFKEYCENNSPGDTAKLLHRYVKDDQPDDFLPGYTSRRMCGIVADSYNSNSNPQCRKDHDWHYMDFYLAMWGDGKL